MELGLFMMVKDEVNRLEGCLDGVLDLFAEVEIVDTGSTDGTQDLLRERFGIEPGTDRLDPKQCHSHAEVRNRGFERMSTPWILSLDADERIERAALQSVIDAPAPEVAGLFCAWNTHRPDGSVFEDYKCSVFRHGVRKRGLIHDNVQVDLRERGLKARWSDAFCIDHFPEWGRTPAKQAFYLDRLRCAMHKEPDWYRYHWFTGYMHFRLGDLDEAERYLLVAATSHSRRFPVECLNAKMVLACIHARHGQVDLVEATLEAALAFHDTVAHDFEVAVNRRLRPWLESALVHAEAGDPGAIRPYAFAC